MLLPFIVISQEISKSNYDSVPVYSKEELKEAILNLRKNKPKKKDETYAYNKDETAPQYPGCKTGNNEKKRKCMSEKLANFIVKEFNKDLAKGLGLYGRQRLAIIFKIDTSGRAIEVRARAPHPKLEKEAIRVIKMLPIIKPGTKNGKKVVFDSHEHVANQILSKIYIPKFIRYLISVMYAIYEKYSLKKFSGLIGISSLSKVSIAFLKSILLMHLLALDVFLSSKEKFLFNLR